MMHSTTASAARRRGIMTALMVFVFTLCAVPAGTATAKRAKPQHMIAFEADEWGDGSAPTPPTTAAATTPETTPTTPEATPDPHRPRVLKMLTKEEIRAVIRAAKPAMAACALKLPDAEARKATAEESLFVLWVSIRPNGTVSDAKAILKGDPAGEACLTAALKALKFPETETFTDVSYPFR
jgi:hypothetical protein